MTKDEMQARLAAVLTELDQKAERLFRAGVPKAMVPFILGAGISACEGTSMNLYGAPCQGDCGWGGSGGTVTGTGGEGGFPASPSTMPPRRSTSSRSYGALTAPTSNPGSTSTMTTTPSS